MAADLSVAGAGRAQRQSVALFCRLRSRHHRAHPGIDARRRGRPDRADGCRRRRLYRSRSDQVAALDAGRLCREHGVADRRRLRVLDRLSQEPAGPAYCARASAKARQQHARPRFAVAMSDFLLAPATPSNTARSGGIVYPIISNIPRIYGSEPGPTAGKIGTYVMWTAFASTAVTSSLFSTALAPNAAALAIAKKTVGIDVSWAQWFIGFAPLGLLLMVLVPLLSYAVCRPEVKSSPEISEWASKELAEMGPMSRNEWIMLALILLAMFLWIAGSSPDIRVPFLGSNFVNATTVVFIVISLMLITGVIEFADIVAEKSAWEVFFYFTSLLTLASGLNEIGFIKWFANEFAKPLAGLSPSTAMILLVALFFWIHYFFSSITSHAAAVLPVVLAVGSGIPDLPVTTLAMLCMYSLGLMGVISPYATGPAPMYFGSGYIGKGQFWGFGLIFGVLYFAGLLLIVWPWLRVT